MPVEVRIWRRTKPRVTRGIGRLSDGFKNCTMKQGRRCAVYRVIVVAWTIVGHETRVHGVVGQLVFRVYVDL